MWDGTRRVIICDYCGAVAGAAEPDRRPADWTQVRLAPPAAGAAPTVLDLCPACGAKRIETRHTAPPPFDG